MITFLTTNQPRIVGFLIGLTLGAGAMYIYIFNPQGLYGKISTIEQNQNAIVGGGNNHEERLKAIEAFLTRAVEESKKK